jgi:hypothetical protein
MESKKLTEESYGETISLKDANEMIEEFISLSELTHKSIKPGSDGRVDPERIKRAEVLNSSNYNAFIFSRDLIQRFFDGTEKDKFNNPKTSNYLMVILGAHRKEKKSCKAGSFTVLTAGCERRIEKVDGKMEVKFFPLNILKPATEYPPFRAIPKFGDEKEGFLPIDHFLVIE